MPTQKINATTKSKRVFVAHMVSVQFKEKILQWQTWASKFPIKLTPTENLHLTIIPPWYTSSTEDLAGMFTKPLLGIPTHLYFQGIVPGPSVQDPRFMWTTAQPTEDLLSIRTLLASRLNQTENKHHFIPHVTLGKLFAPFHVTNEILPLDFSFSWEEKITEVSLIESHLSKFGANYSIIATIPLPKI